MKTFLTRSLVLFSSLLAFSTVQGASKLKTDEEKFAYIMGFQMGARMMQQFQQQQLDLDMEVVAQGIVDSSTGENPKLDEAEIKRVMEVVGLKMQEKQKKLQAEQEAVIKEMGEKNKKEGAEFLAKNAKQDGVKVTDSGLQYKVLSKGKGKKPKATDSVTVNYRGTLISGDEFDSSYKRGEPATFALNQVIKGWTEGLQLMKEGAKYEFYIPSDLAYGPGGAGARIGPNATLVFEVELISVNAGD